MTKKSKIVNRRVTVPLYVVSVQFCCRAPLLRVLPLKKIISSILGSEGVKRGFLGVVFVSDEAMRVLNRRYLKKDRSTDVLAFDYAGKSSGDYIGGDAFISWDTARRVSKKMGIPLEEEVLRYVIHAILHLLGYDDLTHKKKKIMWKRQEEYVRKVTTSQRHKVTK